MSEARAAKVAVVDEVRERFSDSDSLVLTEYRNLDVPAMASLREALREVGGDYKIYKNTLVRFAIENLDLEIDDLLSGPTAIAFVGKKPDGSSGDPVSVAKALKDFAKKNEALVIKGGVLENRRLTVEEINQLAEIAPRDVLLSQMAGLLVAPMQQFAGLLNALPQKFAYALQALVEKSGGVMTEGADDASDAEIESEESSGADDASDAETEEEESSGADDASDVEIESEESSGADDASDAETESEESLGADDASDVEIESEESSGADNASDAETEEEESSGADNASDAETDEKEA